MHVLCLETKAGDRTFWCRKTKSFCKLNPTTADVFQSQNKREYNKALKIFKGSQNNAFMYMISTSYLSKEKNKDT